MILGLILNRFYRLRIYRLSVDKIFEKKIEPQDRSTWANYRFLFSFVVFLGVILAWSTRKL